MKGDGKRGKLYYYCSGRIRVDRKAEEIDKEYWCCFYLEYE